MRLRLEIDDLSVRYTQWLLKNNKWVLAITVVITGAFMSGLYYFVIGNNYEEIFFDDHNARVAAYEKVKQDYTHDDNVFFVVTAKNGEVFSRRTLEAVEYLTDKALEMPYAVRVDSLTNFHYAFSEGDDLLIRPLIENPAEMSDEALAEARNIAMREPILQKRLVKEGSPVTGVNVTLNLPVDVPRVSSIVTAAADTLRKETEQLFPEVSIRMTGIVPLNDAFLKGAFRDLFTLVPVMLAIIIFSMTLLLKSSLLMGAVVLVVALSAFSTLGIFSMLGYETAGAMTVMPLVVLTLAVADCVHILVSMQNVMRTGANKATAIVESMRINMVPVFVTSITTAIGFLCMNVAPVPNLRLFGNFTALGVMLAWWLAIFLLPVLAFLLPFKLRSRRGGGQVRTCMNMLGEFVLANKGVLIFGLGAITILIGINLASLEVNNQLLEWFDNDIPIRQDTEYAMDNLTGIYQLVFNVPAGKTDGVNDPEYLQNLEKFAQYLKAQENVVQVSCITNTLKRLNQAMHGDDPTMYRLPETRDLAAQYLLLYEMSLPAGVDLNTEVNVDKSATRVVATLKNLSSERLATFVSKVEQWQRQNMPAPMFSPALGPAVMFSDVAAVMMQSIFSSAPLALALVSIALMLTLRSFKYGIVSLIPNIMPLIIGFGLWGYMGKCMDMNMTSIVAMTLGIVVDDTVHFLSKYLRARREFSLSPEDGIRYAFDSVGKAMWFTSFILVAGYSVMILSDMATSSNMGMLTSIIIVAALAGDFLLLPSILIYTDTRKEVGYATLAEVQHKERTIAIEA